MAVYVDDKYIQDILMLNHAVKYAGNQPYLDKERTDHTWSAFLGGNQLALIEQKTNKNLLI